MDQILSERDNVNPPSFVDTMTLQSTSAGSEENDSLGMLNGPIPTCQLPPFQSEV